MKTFAALSFCWILLLTLVRAHGDDDDPNKLSLSADHVHWGYFSKTLTPVLNVSSGTTVTVEMATHHACDDWDRMIQGDDGMMDVYKWDETGVNEEYV